MARCKFAMLIFLFFCSGCENAAHYTIDDRPLIKLDTGYLGIWKIKEDTVKGNFIFVETDEDTHEYKEYSFGSSVSRNNNYYITYFDHGGINPHYQQWTMFISEINNNRLLNIGGGAGMQNSYVFLRILSFNSRHDSIIIATVADTTLKYLRSSSEVRKMIAQKINIPSFYKDTIHLYKVSNYHATLKGAVKIANERK